MQKWNKKHLVGNTVQNHNHLAEIKWLCQHVMWWWFLTCDNIVQREDFNRIPMKLLMRQHGNYSKTCFWRTNLNENTDLANLIPASFSLFSTGFAILYHFWSLCRSIGASLGAGVHQLCCLDLVTGMLVTVQV